MPTLSPAFSVVIPAYNVADILPRALESVLAQTFESWEIVIVDDASADETVKVAKAWAKKDSRIRLIEQAANGGPAIARNAGFTAAKGEWIAVLDADDAWTPERLAVFREAIRDDFDIMADNQLKVDPLTQEVCGVLFDPSRRAMPLDESFLWGHLPIEKIHCGWLKPLFRRSFLLKHGLRYIENIRFGEDFILLAECILAGGKGLIIPQAMYMYTLERSPTDGKVSSFSRSARDYRLFIAQLKRILMSRVTNLRSLLYVLELDGVLLWTEARRKKLPTWYKRIICLDPRVALVLFRRIILNY